MLPKGIEIDDPRPIAASAPYTFFMPHPAEIAALKRKDGVQFVFRQADAPGGCAVERMWVFIDRIDDGWVYGALDNEPYDMTVFKLGERVVLPLSHVISTAFCKGHERPKTPPVREFWERCMVDLCVLEGRSHVDYLYREVPDMTQEGDKYPDSGWRLRGTPEAVEADRTREHPFEYIALGKALNQDDRWLHLIDEGPGVAFQWNADACD